MPTALRPTWQRTMLTALTLITAAAGVAIAQPMTTAPGDTIRLPEVTISAPARLPGAPLPPGSVPSTVEVITGEEIRRSGATSVQDYLRRLPGVALNDEQGNSLQPDVAFRGFQVGPVTGVPQGISVFVDGVRVNEPTVEEVNFDLIPMEDVERIELIRGPSAIFGRNTLAGSLNIVTRRGESGREIVPEVESGSFGRQKYRGSLAGAQGPVDYYVAGTIFREDGWRDLSEARLDRAFGKLGFRGGDTDVALSFQYSHNHIEQAGSLPPADLQQDRQQNFTGGDFFEPRLYFGILNVRQSLGSEAVLALNAFGRKLDAEQFNASLIGDNTRTFTDTLSLGGAAQISWEPMLLGGRHHIAAGVEYTHHAVESTVFEEKNARTLPACLEEAEEDGEDPATACPRVELSTDVRDRQHAIGVYVQDAWEVAKGLLVAGDSLVITGAVRWDWLRHDITDDSPSDPTRPSAAGVHTFHRVNPRAGINYNLSRDTGVYVSYAEGFRAPAFLELTCASPGAICPGLQAGVAPDPPLEPVKARNYEIGARFRPRPWLDGRIALFRTDVIDDIFSVTPTGTLGVFFQNIGDTRRQGLEVAARATSGRRLDAHLAYTYTEATFRNDVELATPRLSPGCTASPCTELVRRGNDIPLIPNHRINAGLDYHVTGWLTLSLTGSYVGEQRLRGDEANVERPLPGYTVLNAGATARWKGFTGSLWIFNLLDDEHETFGTFAPNGKLPGDPIQPFTTPAPPIHVMVGLSYRF